MEMAPGGSRSVGDVVLVCADVLGAFGVSASDVKRYARKRHAIVGRSVEALEELLTLDVDPTALLREMIASGDRGIECPARYPDEALARALSDAFEAVRWSVDVEPTGDGFAIAATDGDGRDRTATVVYPETPLESNNAPAVLHGINEWILYGTDARFVLLSPGRECWRAALVKTDALEDVRERYGERVPAFDPPLLPPVDLESFVPDAHEESRDPWPAWATGDTGDDGEPSGKDDSLRSGRDDGVRSGEDGDREPIDGDDRGALAAAGRESAVGDGKPTVSGGRAVADAPLRESTDADRASVAEADRAAGAEPAEPAVEREDGASTGGGTVTRTRTRSSSVDGRSSAEPIGSRDGYELVGRSPAVSRSVSSSASGSSAGGASSAEDRRDPVDERAGRESVVAGRSKLDADELEFGVLNGPVTSERVSNDSFGAEVEPPSEEQQIQAVGIALGSGENISVKGLLHDEEFLPKLPAREPEQVRIEYEDEYDPAALPKAKAAAEESGFVWVDSGSLETTRVPNG